MSLRILVVLACLSWTAAASATVVVPVSERDLVAQASGIVIGQVSKIQSYWDAQQGAIFTAITLDVDEVLKGTLSAAQITLTQRGGTVGDVHAWVLGNPEFVVGERALVFVSVSADGTLRATQLYQGKLSIVTDDFTGDDFAYQDPDPAGVHAMSGSLARPGVAGPIAHRLSDLRSVIHGEVTRSGRHGASLAGRRSPSLAAATTETSGSFTFLAYPGRWFEPDNGRPVVIQTDEGGQPGAPTGGFEQVRSAIAAWSSVSGSSLRLVDGGLTSVNGMFYDGINAIIFGDPEGRLDPPVSCRGILAVGGYFRSAIETRTVSGKLFYRILDGDVSVADGWAGCHFYDDYNNFAEVVTHEIGHVLGYGHSLDADATMYYLAHFDGRGASLKADDLAAVLFSYPATTSTVASRTLTVSRSGNGRVTSVPAGIDCGSDCSQSFPEGTSVTLSAQPATGAIFLGWSGACTGSGACTVTMSTNRSVTATFGGADLVVSAVSNPPAAALPGGRFAATDTTANVGGGSAASTRTRYYLSLGTSPGSGDVLLSGSRSVSSLAPGAQATGAITVTIPSTMALGTYRLLACADDTRVVTETNETNNCRASGATVRVARPDLVVTSLGNPPANAIPGGRFIATDTTANQGPVLATSSTTRYYLSLDSTRDASDRLLSGSRNVSSLSPGAQSTGSVTVTIPTSTPAGSYVLMACADDLSRVIEDGGANNCRATTARITVGP